MAAHSSVLAWRIPGLGEPGGLLSVGLHGVGHDQSDLAAVNSESHLYKGDCVFHQPVCGGLKNRCVL